MPDKLDTDFMELSDEEFENITVPDFDSPGSDEEETPPEGGETETPEVETEEADTPEVEEVAEVEDNDPTVDTEDEKEDTAAAPEESTEETEAIDYKAAYETLMAPFKANGTTMEPKSPEDLIELAKMGANYHKKMQGIAPARKVMKTLENAGLLDEDKVNYLIDLSNGDKAAITKFLKEQNVDPLEINVTDEVAYTPGNHTASDREVALDDVLLNIRDSTNYSKTLDTVSNIWDEASRSEIAANPQIIQVINAHMDNGVYDKVASAVSYERSLGRLSGISDFDAYKQMGNKLEAEGTLYPPTTPAKEVGAPVKATDPAAEQKRQAQKKAASPTKTSSKKVGALPKNFNPLDLSDEEFAKFDPKQLGIS